MTRQSDPARRPAGHDRLSPILLAPLLPFAYPALAGLMARSEVPLYLGRYSASFLAFNLLGIAVFVLVIAAWWRGSHRVLQLGYLVLIAVTVLVPMNNQLLVLPGIMWVLPIIRLLAGAALALAEFDRQRLGRGRARGTAIGLGSILITLSLIDLVLLVVISSFSEERQHGERLREVYDLTQIDDSDVVIVGDSFVWGQGVSKDERFGDRLSAMLADRGEGTRVFSLGESGSGLTRYIEMLEALPPGIRAGRVVIAFYLNDMPAHETLRVKLQALSTAVGRGIPSIRLIGDKIAILLVPDVDAYHWFLEDALREDHPSYPARARVLDQRLTELYRLAALHSVEPPLMLILPIMVDFVDYPLRDGHAMIAETAEAAGFEVLDLLPIFRAELGDGDAHRAAPNDSHFDARTHALLARTLLEAELVR